MRKRYRYGIFIASAILACAPLAMNNNVMGSHVVKAAAGAQGSGDPTHSNSDDYDGRDYDHAYQASVNYDKDMHTDIKLTKDLNENDVSNYFNSKANLLLNGQKAEQRISEYDTDDDDKIDQINNKAGYDVTDEVKPNPELTVYDKDGRNVSRVSKKDEANVSMSLEAGDKLIMTGVFNTNVLPNKWYSWKLQDNGLRKGNPIDKATKDLGALPDEIADRIHYDAKTNTIALRTDEDGNFPEVQSKKNMDGEYQDYDFGADQIAPSVTFTISNDPNDKNAFEIPHDPEVISKPRNYINGAPVVPDDDITTNGGTTTHGGDKDLTAADPVKDDPDANSSAWETAPVDNGNDFNLPTVKENDVQNTIQKTEQNIKNTDPSVNDEIKEGAKKIADVDGLVFVHNAFIYGKDGKVVKKHGVYEIKRIDQKAKILDNGKVHVIKGKEYYRIGKNRYVKVANVGKVANKVQKVNMRGTIKASKKYSVKLYNENGKATGNVLRNAKKVKFDQKKYMHGFTFYRIKGTDTWIRSGNIKFIKSSKK